MMKIKLYQVDAFSDVVFKGNPAAVCPLQYWLEDNVLQQIAQENNLSETAFFIAQGDGYQLRWFTPAEEVDLCGHATLASAHILFQHLNYSKQEVVFYTRSGELKVTKVEQGYRMVFPASMPKPTPAPEKLLLGLGNLAIKQVLSAFDYIIVLENTADLYSLTPDFNLWAQLDLRGVVVTAKGHDSDFISRSFFPGLNVNEDPVTGSSHCELAPYWQQQLNKSKLIAKQVSAREGVVLCEVEGDKVILIGQVVDYMSGEISL